MSGCAGEIHSWGVTPLSPAGAHVSVSMSTPDASCRPIGPVIGAEHSSSLVEAEEHVARALNDTRNRTAQLGGNLVQIFAPNVETMQYGVVGATVTGTAFACPSAPTASGERPVAAR